MSGIELPGGYVVREVIGRGGMGVLYRADQPALGRSVAIKFLHPDASKMSDARERFVREARAAGSLSHPNSVNVFDFGEHAGQLYIVMELLVGESLAAVLGRESLLPSSQVVEIVTRLLAALEEAHHRGLVHRDIKPENLFVLEERTGMRVKLVDFGLAKTRHGRRLTRRGSVTGTPSYMSPEQITAKQIDNRSDLYAVGVLLFELLTGHVPFSGEDSVATMRAHLHDELPDPFAVAPVGRMTADIAAVLRRALQKDPARRFQTAASFGKALMEATRPSRFPAKAATERCARCNGLTPADKHYCGECGAPRSSAAPRQSARQRTKCGIRR